MSTAPFTIPAITRVEWFRKPTTIPTDVIEAIEGTILSGPGILDKLIEDLTPLLAEDVAEHAGLDRDERSVGWGTDVDPRARLYCLHHHHRLVLAFTIKETP